ncbi:hypothetical protein GQ53DRAFT_753734 [Thozetella sp. PMI_491]|nr:hypothetical protein GQ53DRAFT_753734 [Thozetella sp. PMI_491]
MAAAQRAAESVSRKGASREQGSRSPQSRSLAFKLSNTVASISHQANHCQPIQAREEKSPGPLPAFSKASSVRGIERKTLSKYADLSLPGGVDDRDEDRGGISLSASSYARLNRPSLVNLRTASTPPTQTRTLSATSSGASAQEPLPRSLYSSGAALLLESRVVPRTIAVRDENNNS